MQELQRRYRRIPEAVAAARALVACLLITGLMVTTLGLAAMPTAFIPSEDQGQIRGYFTLPEGASLARSVAVMDSIREVVAEEPLVRTGNFYAGTSFGQSGEDRGSFYLRLQPLQQRQRAEQSSEAVKRRLAQELRRRIDGARVVVTTPSTVRGFSSESGLQLELMDRSSGRLSLEEFEALARRFISCCGSQRPIRTRQHTLRRQRTPLAVDAGSGPDGSARSGCGCHVAGDRNGDWRSLHRRHL